MARVYVVYGARGAGKTTSALKLADALVGHGVRVGGFFQRKIVDDEGNRSYDLVRFGDRGQILPLARTGVVEPNSQSSGCSCSFSPSAFSAGAEWLRLDAQTARVLVIDEISKLEAQGDGHAPALRWALSLDDAELLLLSVRGDQLYRVVEAFGLEDRIAGYLELPADPAEIAMHAERVRALVS